MIARMRGRIIEKTFETAIVDVGGVGYEVLTVPSDLSDLQVGDEAAFMIHEYLREDQHTLYGFRTAETKQFFVRLIGISGIGPKVALAILSAASLDNLKQAIATGDPDLLRGVSGVGNKTAQRVILELKGKLDQTAESSGDETYQALVGLGYTPVQAAGAVAKLPAEVKDSAQRVKLALKGMSK